MGRVRRGDIADQNHAGKVTQAQYHLDFKSSLNANSHKAIHENIGIAALIRSDLHWSSSVRYETLDSEQWEYMGGLMWPNDPSSYLFPQHFDNNRFFDDGMAHYKEYSRDDKQFITRVSHYGDLKFLHAMTPSNGEAPQLTKAKIMYWLEVMYKLACGDQGDRKFDTFDQVFPGVFGSQPAPKMGDSLTNLILGRTTGYKVPNIPVRALGVCMHIMSDSYVLGRTQRNLLNPEDLASWDSEGCIQFKTGTTARFGSIEAFHDHNGQRKDRKIPCDQLNTPFTLAPNDLTSFDSVFGARDAINKLTTFLNFYARNAAWTDVQKFLTDDVFALDIHYQSGESNVDSDLHLNNIVRSFVQKEGQVSFEKGNRDHDQIFGETISLVEAGLGQDGQIMQGYQTMPLSGFRLLDGSTRAAGMLRLFLCLMAGVAVFAVFVHQLA